MAFPDLAGVADQIAGPGDAATVLIAGAAGLVVDAGLNVVGFLSPAVVGVTAASAALGAKKSYEAGRKARKGRRRTRRAVERAEKVIARLEAKHYEIGVKRLRAELELHGDGVIDNDELTRSIDEVLDTYRADLTSRP